MLHHKTVFLIKRFTHVSSYGTFPNQFTIKVTEGKCGRERNIKILTDRRLTCKMYAEGIKVLKFFEPNTKF